MPGVVEAIIGREVAGRFAIRQRSVTVTPTVTEHVRNDPERAGLLLVNTGSAIIDVAWERPGGSGNAIPLAPNGGSLSIDVREDFVLPTHSVLASVGAGTSTLLILEVLRVAE